MLTWIQCNMHCQKNYTVLQEFNYIVMSSSTDAYDFTARSSRCLQYFSSIVAGSFPSAPPQASGFLSAEGACCCKTKWRTFTSCLSPEMLRDGLKPTSPDQNTNIKLWVVKKDTSIPTRFSMYGPKWGFKKC